ncbi:glycosyltransferase [Modestobacter sp. I12A-02628]|uniref:Glycosyltransferase family 2 protein n=1 Tax=Goekera deserti TaxID=2497753 RepID=A0A7K3WCU7_9ACTN|nr:glycosyltransferase family 2 protein [Goekera deserti]MPQ98616.1 glycosyltransferase [Goekera deserti]NDI49012.1 glycosyltransferase [Goekera deserti]NEL54197.1 glycosyltransferase family 2 protein [Goekera deserti]
MTGPLVSILVPTYNGSRFIGETLRSALKQSHRNIEVVVADDASTDGTPGIVEAIAATDRRVRLIRHERNTGAFRNPVSALEQSRGQFVKFLLHDDLLAPGCVERLMKGLRSPSVTLAFSHRAAIDETGAPVEGSDTAPMTATAGVLPGRDIGNHALMNLVNPVGELTTAMFRRSDVDLTWLWQVDGRRLELLGDLALWLRLLSRGDAFYEPRPLSSFREHPGQQSQRERLQTRGTRDWPRLIDWGRRNGFLTQPGQELRAQSNALASAAVLHNVHLASQHSAAVLDAVWLSAARLLELRTGATADDDVPLTDRAHAPEAVDRLRQEVHAWAPPRSSALAAPRTDAAEVAATVAAFRDVQAHGAALRFVLVVPPEELEAMIPLAEAALAAGPDLDVELRDELDPPSLLDDDVLAVVPRGRTWDDGRAGAVWSFDPVRVPDAHLPGDTRT